MARKKKPEEHANHERWLVSYADFITLLFAFFVVMYSVSSVNEGKYRVLSDSLLSAFHSSPKSLEPIQVGRPSKSNVSTEIQFKPTPSILTIEKKGAGFVNDDTTKKIDPSEIEEIKKGDDKDIGMISNDVILAMSNLIDLGLITVRRNDLWLEIEISNSILFSSTSAKLKSNVIPVLEEIANILYKFPNSVRIEGYSDSDSISSKKFPSNWELSSARASSIARLFELSKILPERLSVVGYGPNRPIADNSTLEGRSKNRRVVLVIVANNDIAKTIKSGSEYSEAPFPSVEKIKTSGLLIEEEKIHSQNSAVGESSESNTVYNNKPVLTDRELSVYRDIAPELLPVLTPKSNTTGIINPLFAPPIRLFTPVTINDPVRK